MATREFDTHTLIVIVVHNDHRASAVLLIRTSLVTKAQRKGVVRESVKLDSLPLLQGVKVHVFVCFRIVPVNHNLFVAFVGYLEVMLTRNASTASWLED